MRKQIVVSALWDWIAWGFGYLIALAVFLYATAFSLANDPAVLSYYAGEVMVTNPAGIDQYRITLLVGIAIFLAVPLLLAAFTVLGLLHTSRRKSYRPDLDDTHPIEWSRRTIEVVIPHNEA